MTSTSTTSSSKTSWKTKSNAAAKWMKSSYNTAKVATSKQVTKMEERLTMEGLLKQAHISLKQFLDPKFLSAEQKISHNLLKNAQGIVFITEVKGGFLFGIKGGSGIIIARTDSNAHINIPSISKVHHSNVAMQWSAPCAVGTGGISFGFMAGATKVDHIIILPTEDHIDVFMGKGQLHLGGSASAVVAKYGRDANVGMTAGPGISESGNVAPIVSYSFGVKGLFGGVSLDGEILKPRKKCNEVFYKIEDISTEDILRGERVLEMNGNEDYIGIIQLLNAYVTGPELGIFPNFAADDNKDSEVTTDICDSDPVENVVIPGWNDGGNGEGK